jgi:predicted membrane metal-binding protein
MSTNGRTGLWLSPGARIGFALTACVVALLIVFVAVPFYSQRADERAKEQRAVVTRQIQRQATENFLHHFDCTYGAGVRLAVKEARDNQRRQAAIALDSIQAAQAIHDQRRIHTSRLARANALQTAGRFDEILKQLKPLDGVAPC